MASSAGARRTSNGGYPVAHPDEISVTPLTLDSIYEERWVETKTLSLSECAFTDNPRGFGHKGKEAMERIAAVGFDPSCDMMWYKNPGKGCALTPFQMFLKPPWPEGSDSGFAAESLTWQSTDTVELLRSKKPSLKGRVLAACW